MVRPSFARIHPAAGDPLKWIECPLELTALPLFIMKQFGKSLVWSGELKGEKISCLLSRAVIQNKAHNVKEPIIGYVNQLEKSASGKGFRTSGASQTLNFLVNSELEVNVCCGSILYEDTRRTVTDNRKKDNDQ